MSYLISWQQKSSYKHYGLIGTSLDQINLYAFATNDFSISSIFGVVNFVTLLNSL